MAFENQILTTFENTCNDELSYRYKTMVITFSIRMTNALKRNKLNNVFFNLVT